MFDQRVAQEREQLGRLLRTARDQRRKTFGAERNSLAIARLDDAVGVEHQHVTGIDLEFAVAKSKVAQDAERDLLARTAWHDRVAASMQQRRMPGGDISRAVQVRPVREREHGDEMLALAAREEIPIRIRQRAGGSAVAI